MIQEQRGGREPGENGIGGDVREGTVRVERLVGRVWTVVRTLHLTLREGEALGAFEQRRDRIFVVVPGSIWLPGENGL